MIIVVVVIVVYSASSLILFGGLKWHATEIIEWETGNKNVFKVPEFDRESVNI